MLESTEECAALSWIPFVYGLVFVHTLKVGFYFYSDKISLLLQVMMTACPQDLYDFCSYFKFEFCYGFVVFGFFTSTKLCSNQLFISHLCWFFVELKYCTFVLLLFCLFWIISPICQKWVKDLGIVLQLVFVSPLLFQKLGLIKVISVALSDRGFWWFCFFSLWVFYFIYSIYVSPHRRLYSFPVPWFLGTYLKLFFFSFKWLKKIILSLV